jgi:hypothetical protein
MTLRGRSLRGCPSRRLNHGNSFAGGWDRAYHSQAMRTLLVLSLVVTASAMGAVGSAQATDPLAPLERYIGTWTYEGDGNGARVSCQSERRWIANHSFVESHRQCETANGPITQVEIYGFDPRRRLYVYWGFNGRVVSTYTSPNMDATVVWSGEEFSATARCTETFDGDGQSSKSQCEGSFDGGKTWQRVSGGTSKRLSVTVPAC